MNNVAAVVLLSLASACGGAAPLTSADEADLSIPPSVFALQFTGTYLGQGPIARLELRPDGSYLATRDGRSERGRYAAGRVRTLPLKLHLVGPAKVPAEVTGY